MKWIVPAIIAAALGCAATATAEEIWRIGVPDRHYREFAIAGRYHEFMARFPHDPVVDARTADAAGHWPYIHPGPADAWAGAKPHTFTVTFDLDRPPTGMCRLDVSLINTHYQAPPVFVVRVNAQVPYRFQLPAGASDASLTDPSMGMPFALSVPFPSRFLKAGRNTIQMTVVSGSWLLYDSLSLAAGLTEPDGPQPDSISAAGTMLFVRRHNRLRQVVQVAVNNRGTEGKATLSLLHGGAAPQTVRLLPGPNLLEFGIPPVTAPRATEVILRVANREWRAAVSLRPERRWVVYAVPTSHTDIGYTDLQENALERHLNNTVRALEECRRSSGFRWNLEVALHTDLVARYRPDLKPTLDALIATSQIGLQGLYMNMLTGLCSSEELARVLRTGAAYRLRNRTSALTASLNDVPSAVGTMPTILRHSGYRFFTDAVNEDRGPTFRYADPKLRQSPFWWEGPDGSRILAVLTQGYAQMSGLGITESVNAIAARLPGWLRGTDRPDYPGTAVIAYGAFSDNVALDTGYARIVAEWNRKYVFPRILLGGASDFFLHVERESGSALPVFKGDFGSYWEDGAASSAYETAIVRHARQRLSAAQGMLALHSDVPYPARAVADAWDSVIFYDEHTWGAWCSVSAPSAEQTLSQWRRKAAFALEARSRADEVATHLGAPPSARSGKRFRVWNPLGWQRNIMVTVPLQADTPILGIVDVATGRAAPSQIETSGTRRLVFVAQDVPPMGFRTYRFEKRVPDPAPILSPGTEPGEWVSRNCRLRIDSATGAVTSLRTGESGTDWVGSQNGHALNQFLYVIGGEGSALVHPNAGIPDLDIRTHTRCDTELIENGPVRAVLHLRRAGTGIPVVETWITVTPAGHIEFRNVVHKEATTSKEAAYFAFPFAVDPSRSRAFVDVPMGVVEAEAGQIPGGCREWYACNTFASVTDGKRTATLLTPSAPLVTFGDIFRGQWRKKLDLSGAIYAYVLNNYWHTNYRAQQGGSLTFSFALDLAEGSFDAEAAWRAGKAALSAMGDPSAPGTVLCSSALVTDAEKAGTTLTTSFMDVSGAEVTALETEGDEIVVQMLNLKPQPTQVTVRMLGRRIASAVRSNLVGENRMPLRVTRDGSVSFVLNAHAPGVVRLKAR
jgi:hypothetical protein